MFYLTLGLVLIKNIIYSKYIQTNIFISKIKQISTMNFNILKNGKLIAILALVNFMILGLFANTAQAKPMNKAIKPKLKASTFKHQQNRSLGLHLTLSRVVADTSNAQLFEQPNFLEMSTPEQIIPLRDKSLIASTYSGQASWYGPGFHGRLTANGERYNQNAMTAAHRHLKFGTRVRVTNLRNRRSVVVRINDRGPYAKGRIIDVSAAAARSLGMVKSGVAPVRVTVLGR